MFSLWETELAIYLDQRILGMEARLQVLLYSLVALAVKRILQGGLFPDPKDFLTPAMGDLSRESNCFTAALLLCENASNSDEDI